MDINQKIPVAVLGATGMVGQRFVQLLVDHPWFELSAVAASERRVGMRYGKTCQWVLDGEMPEKVSELIVQPTQPGLEARIVFSALPAEWAREVEPEFARAGYIVCSNASAFRTAPDVPLLIPEINHDHLALLENQRKQRDWEGLIITSPNCTTTGIALPMKPLHDLFGIEKLFAVTMQAVSGAGYPGISFLDIEDNVIPYIGGEEEKIEQETRLLLGSVNNGNREPAAISISAQANRVSVKEGHTVCLSVEFKRKPSLDEVVNALRDFKGSSGIPELPSSPEQILVVRDENDRPQPKRDRGVNTGMSVVVGRIRECPLLDYRMVTVSHNTLRGAASGSVLNAELLVAKGYL
jgi:aspartate-semialdehyde dehydrogenase